VLFVLAPSTLPAALRGQIPFDHRSSAQTVGGRPPEPTSYRIGPALD